MPGNRGHVKHRLCLSRHDPAKILGSYTIFSSRRGSLRPQRSHIEAYMNQRAFRLSGIIVATLILSAVSPLPAQTGAKNGEWRTYGGDLGNTKYSPLDQINASNFNTLKLAWRFHTENLAPRPEYNMEDTPLMVNGVVYTTAGARRDVVALDAATGELLWVHSEKEGPRGAASPRQLSGRGVAWWKDGADERILYVTPGYRLIALDAKTGAPVPTFGKTGVVDLKMDGDQQIDLVTGEVGLHATGRGQHRDCGRRAPRGRQAEDQEQRQGLRRGFDVKTGKRLWIFHTIPKPGEFGYDTWEKDAAEYTGNTGAWAQISVDEDLGMAYLPVELPTGDFYGGHVVSVQEFLAIVYRCEPGFRVGAACVKAACAVASSRVTSISAPASSSGNNRISAGSWDRTGKYDAGRRSRPPDTRPQ